jgi:tetratricopeptide (TPR) repeat protein
MFMTHSPDRTRPTSPVDQLQYAIKLVKAGRKVEARQVLRRVVALQPVNQAAWLWLSAIAADRAEAEAALAQVRRINPLHPSLKQAEQWLARRFDVQPNQAATLPMAASGELNQVATVPMPTPTEPNQAATLPMPSPQPLMLEFQRPGYLPKIPHLVTLASVAVAAFVGLGGWFLGVTLPVSATTGGQSTIITAADDLLKDRPAALDEAWAKRDWTGAIAILEGLHQSRPNSESIKDQLTHAYLQQGIAQRDKGFVVEAQPYFERTLLLNPHQLRAKQEQRLASDYLAGVEHYQAGRWAKAIEALEAVQIEDADYVHVKDLLYSAYYNQGLALQAAAKMNAARESLEAAIALRPDLPEPRRQIAEIEFALAPQSAPEPPIFSASTQDKLIVVGIAEQRMWVFEKDKKVFDFIVSTGEPGSDTAIGNFEILDKIDVAYASTWNLDMPYWMGIYWAGSTMENGIHSLPIVKHTGYKLWDGYLGQRVSYGCVILSDENAATLYEWASVGVKVKIVPSLAAWSLE